MFATCRSARRCRRRRGAKTPYDQVPAAIARPCSRSSAGAHTATPASGAAGGVAPAMRRTMYPATPESASPAGARRAERRRPRAPGRRRATACRAVLSSSTLNEPEKHAGLGAGAAREDRVVVHALDRGRVHVRRHRARRRGEQQPVAVDVVVVDREGRRGLPAERRGSRVGVAAASVCGALCARVHEHGGRVGVHEVSRGIERAHRCSSSVCWSGAPCPRSSRSPRPCRTASRRPCRRCRARAAPDLVVVDADRVVRRRPVQRRAARDGRRRRQQGAASGFVLSTVIAVAGVFSTLPALSVITSRRKMGRRRVVVPGRGVPVDRVAVARVGAGGCRCPSRRAPLRALPAHGAKAAVASAASVVSVVVPPTIAPGCRREDRAERSGVVDDDHDGRGDGRVLAGRVLATLQSRGSCRRRPSSCPMG